jgi:hypothetical protein
VPTRSSITPVIARSSPRPTSRLILPEGTDSQKGRVTGT